MSNPTVGSGLQAVLQYLHPKKIGDHETAIAATSGIGGTYTDSGSKVIGVFHDDYFDNDKYRFKALLGVADLNLGFYLRCGRQLIFLHALHVANARFSHRALP